jgi:colanic acid biosynthesis glycosyl transferase WcaI
MRILVVTQYFWPENFRINDLCAELVNRGHQVSVLTGTPNYPEGILFPEFASNPSSYYDYKGCSIIRVPVMVRGDGSSIKLLLNYISYIISASFIGVFKIRKQPFDVIFVYGTSPVTVCLPALLIKSFRKIPVIFWVLDLWPETLEAIGVVKSPVLIRWVGYVVRFIYNRCDLVLGQSKAFYDCISSYCDKPSKIKYFPSWSEPVFTKERKPDLLSDIEANDGFFKILFAGNIGEAQDFPSIIKAAQILKEKQINAKFLIIGDGRAFEHVESEVENLQLKQHVELLGRFPLESMPSFYSSADALLVTLKDSKVFAMTIPGKVQSYMAAGKPILGMLSGEGSRVIDEASCGLIAVAGDYEMLASNVIKLISLTKLERIQLAENGRNYSSREFNREKLIQQLESWFVEVSSERKE